MYIGAAVTYIDSSAIQALRDLDQEYKSRNIQARKEDVYIFSNALNNK